MEESVLRSRLTARRGGILEPFSTKYAVTPIRSSCELTRRRQVLTHKMAQDYSVIQMFEAKQLSVDLLDKPQDFYMHNRRYAASVIMQVTYGWRIPQCTLSPSPHGVAKAKIGRGLPRNLPHF